MRRWHLAISLLAFSGCRCTKEQPAEAPKEPIVETTAKQGGGMSAPIAAAHVANGDVLVAGLDATAKAVRVQRISPKDMVVTEKTALSDVTWTNDADLKLVASADGAAVTWRGVRAGKLVRQLVVLGQDLAPRAEPADVSATSCATREGIWFAESSRATMRPWNGAPRSVPLPKEKEASLLCSPKQAFAVIEDDDHTSLATLGADSGAPTIVMRDKDFGEDEQRERSEYTIGDDVGMVRLGRSGALALRELTNGTLGPMRKLKSAVLPDDDVVAVDASGRIVVIVYTIEAETDGASCTRVAAIRYDRQSQEESTVDLAPTRCGTEVGPFFTSAVGDAVSVAWGEREGSAGKARAPIVALAHASIPPAGAPKLGRLEQPADALVDAGCDGAGCYAAALAGGQIKVLRY